MSRRSMITALVVSAWLSAGAMAQSFSLNDFISIAQSLGTELGPEATPSSTFATSSSPSSTLATSTSASSTSASASATSTSAPATQVNNVASPTGEPSSSNGLDPRARAAIIAVAIIVGVFLLGLLIGCLCFRRRRRRNGTQLQPARSTSPHRRSRAFAFPWFFRNRKRQRMSEMSQNDVMSNNDWEKNNGYHHGYNAAAAPVAAFATHPNHSNNSQRHLMQGRLSENNSRPTLPRPPTNEHPAFRNEGPVTSSHTKDDLVHSPAPARKPVPTKRHNYRDGTIAAGLAALSGAAAFRHHKKKQNQAAENEHLAHGIARDTDDAATSYDPGRHHLEQPRDSGVMGAVVAPDHHDSRHRLDSSSRNDHTSGVVGDDNIDSSRRRSYEPGFDDSRYSYDSYKRDSNAPLAAGAVALAGTGAMAGHELGKHTHEHSSAGGESSRSSSELNRPPTPFGLAAATQHNAGVSEARPDPFRHGSFEPTVAAMQHHEPDSPYSATRRSGSFPDPTVTEHNQSNPYRHTADPPTNAQRRSLQDREQLLAGPEREVEQAPSPADHNSTYVSYDEAGSNSSGIGTANSSSVNGLRVPPAAVGAVGRDSPRVLAVDPGSPTAKHASSLEDDEAADEHTPLSVSSNTGSSTGRGPGRSSILRNANAAQNPNPTHYSGSHSSDSGSSWRSAHDSSSAPPPQNPSGRPSMVPHHSSSFGLPTPSQPWTVGMPGSFPGERPAVPAYTLGSGRHSGGYSPVRQAEGGAGSASRSPALRPTPPRAEGSGSSSSEYDPYSYNGAAIGSGRRSFGSGAGSPARAGGVVRFSSHNDEWRYDDGDDYSDRGGGGGNVYDGYKYGGGKGNDDVGTAM